MEMLKKISILLLLLCTTNLKAQLFRFATLYSSYSLSAPFVEKQDFLVSGVENYGGVGILSEITRTNPPGINLTFGLRKIARFEYQVKQNQFYTGQENEVSDYATISNASGLEYLLEFSRVRNREIIFSQHEYRLRYISENFTSRASYVDNNIVSLQYTDAEVRYRKNFGNLDITAGIAHRSHPIYGYSPIDEWLQNNNDLRDLAYMYGYWDFLLQIPFTENYLAIWYKNVPPHAYDNWSHYDDVPVNEFPDIQNIGTNQEFFREEFPKIVERYNREQEIVKGFQHELSTVLGLDYYYYRDNFWLHCWGSLYPLHTGLTKYSYNYKNSSLDFDVGFILGSKFNSHFSIFVEGRYVKFWEIDSYGVRTGINYLIF
jgi:hypothetical protein